MKKILLIILLLVFFFQQINSVFAQRYAVCDLCGLCPTSAPPSNWESCRQCIYPMASSDPSAKETLTIDELTNNPPTPFPGNQYTIIGCISTNLGGFTKEGAAGGVSQILLNVIFSIVGGLAFLYLLYGSFVVLTSQQDPERLNQGKRIIFGSIVGLIFSLFAVFIINLLATQVLKIPGF